MSVLHSHTRHIGNISGYEVYEDLYKHSFVWPREEEVRSATEAN